jgi:subtilisin family serine protease
VHPVSRPRLRSTTLLAFVLVTSSIAIPLPAAGAQQTVRLVVTFDAGASAPEADRAAENSGGRLVGRIPQLNVRVVELPAVAAAQARERLAGDPLVTTVETDGLVQVDWTPTDPLWGAQWEHRQVRAPKAWDLTRGAASTVVAVVDTGVQAGHPDLAGQLVAGHDFVNEDDDPADDHGHGTAVAGVVAALASNGIGVAGGCSRCRVMPIKTMGDEGTGYWSVAAQGITWAADHGADVINLSFGGPTGGTTLYSAIAYARSKGAVVIASAGNSGSTSAFYPAAYDGVISVTATSDLDLRYSWSNYSSSWVTLAAPGCTHTTVMWSAYKSFCGTSAAAPVVSSVAALVESRSPALSRAQIETVLRESTVATPYAISRYGRIDAYAAVHRAAYGSAPATTLLAPSAPLLAAGTRLVFLAGDHVGYRFGPDGAIVGSRRMSLGHNSGAETTKRQTIPGRSGYWFHVANGGLAGYWVQESSRVYLAPAATPTPTPTPTPKPTPTPTPAVSQLSPSSPHLNPALKVLFRAGTYTGIRVDVEGNTIGTRSLTLAWTSGANTAKIGWLPGRTGSWFYIVNGALAGYWVRATDRVVLRSAPLAAPGPTTVLAPPEPLLDPKQRIRFAAGDHVGYRFATDGSVLGKRRLLLGRTSGASMVMRMRVPGRSGWWLYIIDGGMAGYWVREAAARRPLP